MSFKKVSKLKNYDKKIYIFLEKKFIFILLITEKKNIYKNVNRF